jgi:cell division protein FtsB
MNPFSFSLPKLSLTTVVVGILSIVVAILGFSAYDSIAGKLGFETKTSLKTRLEVSEAQVSSLQDANAELVKKIADQEERHAKELASAKQLADHRLEVAKELAASKERLAAQNADLKEKLKAGQSEAYLEYSIPKDLYYVYLKEDVNKLSNHNYDTIKAFLTDPPNSVEPENAVPSSDKKATSLLEENTPANLDELIASLSEESN